MSGGKLEEVENSIDSLHTKRSLLIEDHVNNKIWVIHGSTAAESTKTSAEKCAKEINAEHGFQLSIEKPNYDEAEQVIEDILNSKLSTSKKKESNTSSKPKKQQAQLGSAKSPRSSIPKVPKINKIENETTPRPKGEMIEEGPEIREFQIAYYEEDEPIEEEVQEESEEIKNEQIKDILLILNKYIKEIDQIMKNKPERKEADNILQSLSTDILDIIY